MMNKKALLILEYFDEILPNVSCELNYENDIQLLIAVMLSAQTTDVAVNKVTKELFINYPTINELISLSVKDIENFINKLGLFRVKSKNVYDTIKIIYDDYSGNVPNNYDDLVSLPGVGRKTANVVLAEFFKIPAIAVDTHVERVSKRLGLAYTTDSVLQVEKNLMNQFDMNKWIKLHHQFIHFGRYICKSAKPQCESCKLIEICNYYSK